MGDASSVTLIFYRVQDHWWREPFLNMLAAAAQRSSYTHVELAIGEHYADGGEMANVLRVFNDATGAPPTAAPALPLPALRSREARPRTPPQRRAFR